MKAEPYLTPSSQSPERRMWGAALALLINDAIHYATSKRLIEPHHKEAFDDLCFCGDITRRLGVNCDIEPAWLSERFRRYVKDAI